MLTSLFKTFGFLHKKATVNIVFFGVDRKKELKEPALKEIITR